MILKQLKLPTILSTGEPPKSLWYKIRDRFGFSNEHEDDNDNNDKVDYDDEKVAVLVSAENISAVNIQIRFGIKIILSAYKGIKNLKKVSDPLQTIKEGLEEDGWINELLEEEILNEAFQIDADKNALNGIAAIVDMESTHKTSILIGRVVTRIKLNFIISLNVNPTSEISPEEVFLLVKEKIREELFRTLSLNVHKISLNEKITENGSLLSQSKSETKDTSIISLHEKPLELPSLDRFKLPEGVKVPEKK